MGFGYLHDPDLRPASRRDEGLSQPRFFEKPRHHPERISREKAARTIQRWFRALKQRKADAEALKLVLKAAARAERRRLSLEAGKARQRLKNQARDKGALASSDHSSTSIGSDDKTGGEADMGLVIEADAESEVQHESSRPASTQAAGVNADDNRSTFESNDAHKGGEQDEQDEQDEGLDHVKRAKSMIAGLDGDREPHPFSQPNSSTSDEQPHHDMLSEHDVTSQRHSSEQEHSLGLSSHLFQNGKSIEELMREEEQAMLKRRRGMQDLFSAEEMYQHGQGPDPRYYPCGHRRLTYDGYQLPDVCCYAHLFADGNASPEAQKIWRRVLQKIVSLGKASDHYEMQGSAAVQLLRSKSVMPSTSSRSPTNRKKRTLSELSKHFKDKKTLDIPKSHQIMVHPRYQHIFQALGAVPKPSQLASESYLLRDLEALEAYPSLVEETLLMEERVVSSHQFVPSFNASPSTSILSSSINGSRSPAYVGSPSESKLNSRKVSFNRQVDVAFMNDVQGKVTASAADDDNERHRRTSSSVSAGPKRSLSRHSRAVSLPSLPGVAVKPLEANNNKATEPLCQPSSSYGDVFARKQRLRASVESLHMKYDPSMKRKNAPHRASDPNV